MENSNVQWAEAISERISDELWSGSPEYRGDVELLRSVLRNCFLANPSEMRRLIGTMVIEEDYFEELSDNEVMSDVTFDVSIEDDDWYESDECEIEDDDWYESDEWESSVAGIRDCINEWENV